MAETVPDERTFRIDGMIESPYAYPDADALFRKFIKWIEEQDCTFGGFFYECDDEGDLLTRTNRE